MNADDAKQNGTEFIAFVSYSHNDTRWATWLHRSIETYRLPRDVAAKRGSRVGRLFLDRSELATSNDLSVRIQEAMDRSSNLLVVCSPAARRSRWVNEEIKRFREAGKADRIFCLIVDGDPASTGDDGCFPLALIDHDKGHSQIEPLAADVRPGKDKPSDARLKLVAGLLDLPFDALKRREQSRRQRLLMMTTAASLALVAIMGALAVAAMLSRNEATRQRDVAQRTVTFLSDLFDGARPESAQGREVSVREMVDNAAITAVASADLRHEPEVRAALLTTLADVYAKLHLPAAGRKLISEAERYPITDRQTVLYRAAVGANLTTISGDYAALRRFLDEGFTAIGKDAASKRAFGSQLLMARAQLAQHENRAGDAERDYMSARSVALDAGLRPTAVSALLAAATADIDSGNIGRGERRLIRVIMERRSLGQPLDPDILTAYNSLGAIAIKRGNPQLAERWFRNTLALQTKVFGPDSLDVALTRSNLGRALVEQRQFTSAREILVAARRVYIREAGDRADVLANLNDSLGLALGGLGMERDASTAFEQGLAVARANAMPKEVELLADLAELKCRIGRPSEGLALITDARRALTRFELTEPWRAAHIDNVAGGCLVVSGQPIAAVTLIKSSTPIVQARWGKNSLFGSSAAERLADIAR